jgi:integrative and conjugative element protein (TIGR02256 family)
MGYWSDPCTEIVITDVIGPGPTAIHRKKSFIPDTSYQEAEVARIYSEADRISSYLGDWHTHPFGSSYLSYRDKRTLQRIAKYGDARCPTPVMAIISGGDDDWRMRVWKYEERAGLARIFGIKVVSLFVKHY